MSWLSRILGSAGPVVVSIAFLFASCASGDHRVYRNCVQNAAADAWAAKRDGRKVRIGHYRTSKPNVNHVQAQAFVDGEWRWLTCHDGSGGEVVEWGRHFDYGDEPRFQTLEEFIGEQL